ncbi:MAG: hypothetical protein IJ527_02685 [Prevotella sp.]|nr:hypothetical protein [Prevotella sp.]
MSVAAGCNAGSATEHAVYKDKKTNTYKRYVICAKKLYDNDMKVVKGFPAALTYKDIVAVQDNIYVHALGCLSEIKL